MIRIENLTKGYGDRILFDQVNLTIGTRERVGLVGRNGHGKTTFFRLLIGEEKPDSGQIQIPKQYRIGHVRQQLSFRFDTILAECTADLPPAESDQTWKAEKILAGLGFSEADMHRSPHEFSGGYQVRLNLAKILVSEPNLLLLDEPTNYLDIAAIRWIERFLVNWPHELMLITHDRSFMDQVVTHTAGIHRTKLRKIPGDTGKYYAQIAQDEAVYEKTRINDERRRREMELFITRFRAKARLANMVQSRIKTLSKLEKQEKLQQIQDLEFSFRSKPYRGKTVMRIQDLAFGYDARRVLFEGLDAVIHANDRVCVVGKNGKGKTTLLKILAGELSPVRGQVNYNPGVEFGFFDQTHSERLNPECTVEEELLYTHADVDRQAARNICGAMMFSGDAALKKISVLSGGEKSRIILGKLLVTPVNLLLLDEPTNHLDMEACDALLAAIDAFDGAVVMVTHNEMFLHVLAERLIVFRDDKAEVFEGNYREFLEKDGWHERESEPPPSESARQTASRSEKLSKKELRRRRSEIIAERSKALKPMETKIERIEAEIEALETAVANDQAAMQDASQAGDGEKIAALSRNLHHCEGEIDRKFDILAELTETCDAARSEFDARLAALDEAAEAD